MRRSSNTCPASPTELHIERPTELHSTSPGTAIKLAVRSGTAMVALSAVLSAALMTVSAGASAQVTVGAVLPLTGSSAQVGEDQRRGIALAVEQINAHGGVLGKPFAVDVEDSGGTAATALDAGRKLVSVGKVPVVLGEFSSGVTIPLGQYVVQQGDVHVNIGSSSPAIRKIGEGAFSVIGLDDLSARFAAQDVHDLKLKKIAIIVPNNSYGQGIAAEFKTRFEALGGTVVASILYTEGQSSYRRELQQVQRTAPDGFVYSAYGQEAATINREAYQLGLATKPWYGIYLTMCTSDTPPEIAKGQIGLEVASSGPRGKTYEDVYKAKYHEGVKSSFGSYAYDAVMLSAAAINEAKSADPAKVRAGFLAVGKGKGYDGVTGPIAFDSDRQRTVQPYLKVKVDGGVVPR